MHTEGERRPFDFPSRARHVTLLLIVLLSMQSSVVDASPTIRWDPGLARDEVALRLSLSHPYGLIPYRGDLVVYGELSLNADDAEGKRDVAVIRDGIAVPLLPDLDEVPGGPDYDASAIVRTAVVHEGMLVLGGRLDVRHELATRNLLAIDPTREDEPRIALGEGLDWVVTALGHYDGELVAGRELVTRGVGVVLLALWNGTAWRDVPMPADVEVASVRAFLQVDDELWVGGMFLAAGETVGEGRAVAVWNGTTWRWPDDGLRSVEAPIDGLLPDGIQGVVDLVEHEGSIYAAGSFDAGDSGPTGVARWTGTAWEDLGVREADLRDLVPYGDDLMALGYATFPLAGGATSNSLCVWTGSTWSEVELAGGVAGLERPLFATDGLVHEGRFVFLADTPWEQFGDGATDVFELDEFGARTLLGDRDRERWWTTRLHVRRDDVVLAGNFGAVGDRLAPLVARWDGRRFLPMSAGLSVLPRPDVVVSEILDFEERTILVGRFGVEGPGPDHIARWTGERWVSYAGGIRHPEFGLGYGRAAVVHEGELVVDGHFEDAEGEERSLLMRYSSSSGWHLWPAEIPRATDPAASIHRPRVAQVVTSGAGLWVCVVDGPPLEIIWPPDPNYAMTQHYRVLLWNGDSWVDQGWEEPWGRTPSLVALDHDVLVFGSSTSGAADPLETLRLDGSGGRAHVEFPDPSGQPSGAKRPLGAAVVNGDNWVLLDRALVREVNGEFVFVEEVEAIGAGLRASGQRIAFLGRVQTDTGQWTERLAVGEFEGVVSALSLNLEVESDPAGLRITCSAHGGITPDRIVLQKRAETTPWRDVDSVFPTSSVTSLRDDPVDRTSFYRVAANVAGRWTFSEEVEVTPAAVRLSRVESVAPNPFNPRTTVEFSLARTGPVRVDVYGLDGRRIRSETLGTLNQGAHAWTWEGRDRSGAPVASGTYVVRIIAPDRNLSARVRLVK